MRVPVLRGDAELGVFVAAHADDVFHMAERLDVVDDGRAHVEAERGGEIRRLDARIRALAFERFDQAGLLAADVGAGAAVDVDLQVEAGAEDVGADEIAAAGFLDRLFQDARGLGKFLADVDVGEVRADGEAEITMPSMSWCGSWWRM